MLQQPQPDDYVIATWSKRDRRGDMRIAFRHAGLDYRPAVIDPALFRPGGRHAPRQPRQGQGQARLEATTDLETLIRMMVDADMERVAKA
jgi:GDPmannose 4,6-dehydratase